MTDREFTEEEIVSSIRQGGGKRIKALKYLFEKTKLRAEIIAFVKANHGNVQDGEDIFSEGLIMIDNHIRIGKFEDRNTSIKGYLFSICRFTWMNRMRKQKKTFLTSDNPKINEISAENPEKQILKQEQIAILDHLLNELGEKCKKILSLWKQNYSMTEIAKIVGLEKESQARLRKYRCIQALVKKVEQNVALKRYLSK